MYIEANVAVEDIASAVSYSESDARQVILSITENFEQEFTIAMVRELMECMFAEGYFKEVLAVADEFRGKVEEFYAE